MINKKQKGTKGEKIALDYLEQQNIKIIEQNFRSRYGEIDIIGLLKNALIFYEVKYRENNRFGDIAYSITDQKRKKILKTAQYFLLLNKQYKDYQKRFDAILINNINDNLDLSIIENFILTDNKTNGVL